ncbi:hypothetical protein JCM31598_26540 [Desulfonatronum parangueonense]
MDGAQQFLRLEADQPVPAEDQDGLLPLDELQRPRDGFGHAHVQTGPFDGLKQGSDHGCGGKEEYARNRHAFI